MGLLRGVKMGWWDDVDWNARLPIKRHRRSEFHEHALWAHVWVKYNLFPSMKEAKRAGWGIPLTCERKRLKTYVIEIEP